MNHLRGLENTPRGAGKPFPAKGQTVNVSEPEDPWCVRESRRRECVRECVKEWAWLWAAETTRRNRRCRGWIWLEHVRQSLSIPGPGPLALREWPTHQQLQHHRGTFWEERRPHQTYCTRGHISTRSQGPYMHTESAKHGSR